MNVVLKQDQYSVEYVQFMKVRKNIIMENSLFIKLLYSDENMVMNSIFIEFPIKITEVIRNIMFFNIHENEAVLKRFIQVEHDILTYYTTITTCQKTPVYGLQTQIEKGHLKYNYVFSAPLPGNMVPPIVNEKCVMKISGIWENADSVGINFKLFIIPTFLHL